MMKCKYIIKMRHTGDIKNMPVGSIVPSYDYSVTGGAFVVLDGWRLCDGGSITEEESPELWAKGLREVPDLEVRERIFVTPSRYRLIMNFICNQLARLKCL